MNNDYDKDLNLVYIYLLEKYRNKIKKNDEEINYTLNVFCCVMIWKYKYIRLCMEYEKIGIIKKGDLYFFLLLLLNNECSLSQSVICKRYYMHKT